MSLLLDALKKAAEKKAKKSREAAADTEQTRADTTVRLDETNPLAPTERLDATEIDATEVEDTHVQTQRLEPEEVDATLAETQRLEAPEIDATEVEDTHVQKTQRMESIETPVAATDGPSIETDTTEFSAVDSATDPTLLVMDDSIPMDGEGNTLIETDDYTAEEMARLRAASRPDLTEEDVTAFLGGGQEDADTGSGLDATGATRTVEMRPLGIEDVRRAESGLDADDTTLTAEEEESTRLAMDDTTARDRPGMAAEAGVDEDDQATVINPETPAASVDLDRLTHEQTLGAETTSRSFAPDNYDRTLIKLSDNDVSRIFPGMKAEPGAVMTPDYAKKVFMSKASRHGGGYLKWMGVTGLVLLLLAGLWGLYQMSEESDRIDTSLARLKRDPMPGIIQPPKEEKIELFAPDTDRDAKALASAPQEAHTPATEPQPEAVTETPGPAQTPVARAEAPVRPVEAEQQPERRPVAARAQSARVAAAPAAAPAAAQPALTIRSSERIDDKDRMLGDAYAAYEHGDLTEARRLYAAVLTQEPENHDALLGMAAIEIQDGDYNRAIELYQKLLLLNPMDSEAMASLIAVANIDPRRGESRIKQMLAGQPDSPYLYFTLGNMYSRQQRWAEAQAAYFQALQLQPDDPNTAYNLAVSLEHLGKPEAAIPFYRRALENRGMTLATFDADQVAQRIEVLSR